MRQKKKETSPYIKALNTLSHLFGKEVKGMSVTRKVRTLASDYRKETGDKQCFMPMNYMFSNLEREVNFEEAITMASCAAVTAWSFTKEVYQFDKDLEDALDKTVTTETKVPMDVLCKLPQWSIAVESSVFKNTNGFLAYIDMPVAEDPTLLIILENSKANRGKHSMSVFPFKLTEGQTIREGVLAMGLPADEKDRAEEMLQDEVFTELEGELCKAVSRILYLVSDKPDIGGHEPGSSKPIKTRLKGGVSSFLIPKDPKVIKTGFEVARGIRAFNLVASTGYADGERGSNAPHIRAAHWHGFWSGKRDSDERVYKVKWLAPIFVNSTEE